MVGIWIRLRKKGCLVHIVSKTTFNDWYMLFQPDAIILPRATSEMVSFISDKVAETEIVVIPSEHGSGFEQKVLNNAFGPFYSTNGKNDSAIEKASLILVGGVNQKKWIENAIPNLKEKLKVTGTLSSDHWFIPKVKNPSNNKVGFSTTFKSMLLSIDTNSVHKTIYEHIRDNYKAYHWRLDTQNFELQYLATIFEAVDTLLKEGYSVDIRPHPHEYWPGWKRWCKYMNGKITINRQVDLASWIDGNIACITSFSTTALDCIARDKPSISLERMLEKYIDLVPKVKEPLRSKFSWQPKNFDELLDLLIKAEAGDLPCSPNLKEAQDDMQNNFYWPREKSSATLCVNEIIGLLEKSEKKRRGLGGYMLQIPIAIVKIIVKELRDYFGPRRSNLLFTFSIRIWSDAYRFNKNINL
jgi:surface carbohydrate biosynthesis protein